eukprot:scaffold31_cov198-Alexandrium_tamarense.AAC.8
MYGFICNNQKYASYRRSHTLLITHHLSTHRESDPVRITASPRHSLLFDYSGFPPESYQYKYDAAGDANLARRIQSLLKDSGIPSELDTKRGLDHGMFIPLMLMYPHADVPVVGISLHSSLDVNANMAIGKALRPLHHDGILIIGSGYSFHNLPSFFNPTQRSLQAAKDFDNWLQSTLVGRLGEDLDEKLSSWESAPGARESHPREEHLLPLFVAAAAAGTEAVGEVTFHADGGGKTEEHSVSSFRFTDLQHTFQ